MEGFSELTVTRYDDGLIESAVEPAAEEYSLSLFVNDAPVISFSCTRGNLDALVVGYALTAGIIGAADEIKMLSVHESRGTASIWLKDRPQPREPFVRPPKKPCDINAVLSRVAELMSRAGRSQQQPSQAPQPRENALHGAALCTRQELALYHGDLSRHNAADKVIGDAALRGLDTTGMMLLTTGRPSSLLLEKAVVCRAAAVASPRAPTRQAVQMARENGIALIGNVAGRRCAIFCG